MIDVLSVAALPPVPNAPVVLMVSGGSDSTALLVRAVRGELDLCDGAGPARLDRGRLHVLHVDHCLRGAASEGDAAFVADLCGRLGVPCTVRRIDVPALLSDGGNMEETARLARYQAAWELVGALAHDAGVPRATARVCVAHTADDRAETFLMRVLAGAGTAGLTGMRATRGLVVRPLLGETRASLRAYLNEQGVGWREDATNAEDAALRSYVRHHVVPPFVERNPAFHDTLATTLDVLADENDLLERLAVRLFEDAARPARPGTCLLDAGVLAGGDPALARRALRRALANLMGEEGFRAARVEARHVEALLGLVRAGGGSCTLPLGVDARAAGGVLALALPEGPAAPPVAAILPVPGVLTWGDAVLEARLVPVPAAFAGDACAFAREHAQRLAAEHGWVEGCDFVLAGAAEVGLTSEGGTLQVGPFVSGERMRPFGMAGGKLVSDVLREAGVAACDRAWVPVVRAARTSKDACAEDAPGRCVWVGGIRLDARAAYRSDTLVLVELRFLHV